MSTDKHVRVGVADLVSERLDTGFYGRAYFVARKRLKDSGLSIEAIGALCEPWSFGAYALTNHIEWAEPSNGIPFFKAESLGSPLVEQSGLSFVTHETHRLLTKSTVSPGDIVVSTSGTVGRVAVVPNTMPQANSNQDTIKFNPRRSDIDNHFIGVQICSRYGQSFLEREAGGAVQQHVYLHNFKRIPLVLPAPDAQHHIGSKVRQAEALREWARAAEASFRGAVGLDVPDASGRGRHSRVASSDLDADLNAGRFTPDRLEVRRALQRAGARRVEDFATISTDNDANPSPRSRYLGLDGISSNSIDLTLQRFDRAGVSGTCRVLPRGAAISKLRPYLNKAAFIPGGVGQVVGSTELLCVRSEEVHAAFLYGVLKLDTTLRQLNPVASGATHPRVGPDEVLDLLVPWHDDHERLGETLERAQQAYFGARALVTAARFLVEALIERKVTEAELIAAGKDPAADRALLSRLRDDGLDGEGQPLFADLDALDQLLAQAKEGASS